MVLLIIQNQFLLTGGKLSVYLSAYQDSAVHLHQKETGHSFMGSKLQEAIYVKIE